MAGATIGFLAGFVLSAFDDTRLSAHGAVVTATVEDTAPYGSDTQYLLSFVVDGQSDSQWATDVGDLKVGDSVRVIVDRRDDTNIKKAATYGRRWLLYSIQIVASVVFAAIGVMFLRMDAAGFRDYVKARYGHPTDS